MEFLKQSHKDVLAQKEKQAKKWADAGQEE